MRFTVVRAGERSTVEVADDLSSAVVDGRTVPVKVVARRPMKVELEIAGEKVVVDQWPESLPQPPGPVDVDGERWSVEVAPATGVAAPAAGPTRPAAPGPSAPVPPVPPPAGGGVAVVPPMPGRVVELKVQEGELVTKGQLLLVLEAMKMRNEIVSPAAGRVQGISVSAGTNVRGRDPMMFVVPGEAGRPPAQPGGRSH